MIRLKGITLIELLVAVTLFASVLALTGPVFLALVHEVPRSKEVIEENRIVGRMLTALRGDVEAARSLSHAGNGSGTDVQATEGETPSSLIIDQAGGGVTYEYRGGVVERRVAAGDESDMPERWDFPHARIAWKLLQENGKAYAVEVRTCIEQKKSGRTLRKLENVHVFFVAAPVGGIVP